MNNNQIDPGLVIEKLNQKLAEAILQITLLEIALDQAQKKPENEEVYSGPVPEVFDEDGQDT